MANWILKLYTSKSVDSLVATNTVPARDGMADTRAADAAQALLDSRDDAYLVTASDEEGSVVGHWRPLLTLNAVMNLQSIADEVGDEWLSDDCQDVIDAGIDQGWEPRERVVAALAGSRVPTPTTRPRSYGPGPEVSGIARGSGR